MLKKMAVLQGALVFGMLSAGGAMAETSVVVEGVTFAVGDNVVIATAADGMTLPEACVTPIAAEGVTIASSIAVVGGEATITTEGVVDPVMVDVSACLPSGGHEVAECIATVDMAAGHIEIPCLEFEGNIYTVTMRQRGNSMNWEVSLVDANGDFLNYRRTNNTNTYTNTETTTTTTTTTAGTN
ncbi:MAG: hypothetical protein ACOY3Z_00500 [Thermodesulfobacteriota bacterium]